jgi:hypothetical protein
MRTISWPQFARQFPQASTGKTHPPQFLHKSEAIFCCEAQRSAAEWVHRKRWNSQRLPNDDCGDAGGSWQFSRVNCQGKSENARERVPVARALRPPTARSMSGWGRWPAAISCGRSILRIVILQLVLVKVALPVSAVGPVPLSRRLAAGRQAERVLRTMRLGWLVRAVFFLGTEFATDLRGSTGIKQILVFVFVFRGESRVDLLGTCFPASSTAIPEPSQLVHNSFGDSLCLRLS